MTPGMPFVAWLLTIAHNLLVDHYKATKKFVSIEETEFSAQSDEPSPEAITEACLNQSYVRNAILKLRGEKQKVILMHFIDGLSYREIAKTLNKSEGAVRVIQYRALNELRSILVRRE